MVIMSQILQHDSEAGRNISIKWFEKRQREALEDIPEGGRNVILDISE
jgi:hypothetical protein